MSDKWNPAQYHLFEKERDAPFFDLVAGLPKIPGGVAVDIGCGTGNLTREMHRALGLKATVGFDNSPAMLEKARPFAGEGLSFETGTIEAFSAYDQYDLIFSNAALQWADDHPNLLRRLKQGLKPGGWLAVQVPANHGHPSHVLASEVACEAPFRDALGGYRRVSPVLATEKYAETLARLGLKDVVVQTRAYLHQLENREAVVEWVKGTLLTDYQGRMPADLWPRFLTRYKEHLLPELRDEHPYLYPFLRTFLWARNP